MKHPRQLVKKKAEIRAQSDQLASVRDRWRKRNWYYHQAVERLCRELVGDGKRILDLGCATGDLVQSLNPAFGVGMDLSPEVVRRAANKYPHGRFVAGDIEQMPLKEGWDAVILSDVVGHLTDVWQALREIRRIASPSTRLVITYFNPLWEPLIALADFLHLKMPQRPQNWLSLSDLENLAALNHWEVVKRGYTVVFPQYIPLLSTLINRYLACLPGINRLCLIEYLIVRPVPQPQPLPDYACSVVVPCRNEVHNIRLLIERLPQMGSRTDVIFVDGASTDGTREEIQRLIVEHRGKTRSIVLIDEKEPKGKGDAVRLGFDAARGEVLLILDADLSVAPEDLSRFYFALVEHKGEMINGSRLVYPMEREAMRAMNWLGNKLFSLAFTWLLGQRIKDTLCGTKALFRWDYEKIKANRAYFGEFDPFGDFDLLLGAARLNLKITELPVRYYERTYGTTKIRRWQHGWLLLRMCWIAFRKVKLA